MLNLFNGTVAKGRYDCGVRNSHRVTGVGFHGSRAAMPWLKLVVCIDSYDIVSELLGVLLQALVLLQAVALDIHGLPLNALCSCVVCSDCGPRCGQRYQLLHIDKRG